MNNKTKLILENFVRVFNKIKRIDENSLSDDRIIDPKGTGNVRSLTSDEIQQIIDSAKDMSRRNPHFDFNQDTALRYQLDGYEHHASIKSALLPYLKFPVDVEINNVVGNMNTTDAHKEAEANGYITNHSGAVRRNNNN
jgi:hypothetical protein